MRNTFSLRHMFIFALTLCLISVVAGAALAQDEPGAPEPVVPVFDLTGSSAEAAAEPAAVNPSVIVPAVTGLTVDGPEGVITTTDPTWDVNATDTNGDASISLYLYDATGYYKDPVTGEIYFFGSPIGQTTTALTPTTGARTAFNASAFEPTVAVGLPVDVELLDGFKYAWQLLVTDGDGTESETGEFFIDVPLVSPTSADTVIITTPLITWPAEDGVAWYAIASVADNPNTADEFDVVSWFDYYPASDSGGIYGIPRYDEGICENDQCKVRPYQSISYDETFSQFVDGDFAATIWVQKLDADFEVVEDWAPLTEFNVIAPEVAVDAEAGPTEGRPQFTVQRTGQTVDELPGQGLLGMTMTVAPDFYYVFLIPGADVEFTFDYPAGFAAEWFRVLNPVWNSTQCYVDTISFELTDDCVLVPYDNMQDNLYNGTWTYWVQGYSTALDGYTNWTEGGTFEINAAAPSADELVFAAGIYEEVGTSGSLDPQPFALTTTWTPAALTAVQSNRPLFHIAPNVQDTEWVNIIIYSNNPGLEEAIVYNEWFNVYEPVWTSDINDEFWYCGWGVGGDNAFTCVFQLPDVIDSVYGGLVDGFEYELYGAAFGPGGFSTGGIGGFGYTDPADNPAGEFSMAAPSALEGLGVDVTGGPLALTRTLLFSGSTFYSLPLTNTYVTGEPRFFWDNEDTATYIYYEIEQNGAVVGGGEWLEVNQFFFGSGGVYCGEFEGLCYFQPLDFLYNGTYTANFQYWNGGLSEEASVQFTIDNADAQAPEAVDDDMFVYVDENLTGTTRPIFNWDHVDGNTWYMVEVQQGGATVASTDWYRATDICGYDITMNEYFSNFIPPFTFEWGYNQEFQFRCQIAESAFNFYIDAFDGTDFTWTVTAYSPSDTVDVSAPADFSLEGMETGAPKPIYPMTETLLTYTVKPTFYFEPGDNAAWYFVYVGDVEDPFAEPLVADWYYFGQDNRPTDDPTAWQLGYPNSTCWYASWSIPTGPDGEPIAHEGDRCGFNLPSDGLMLENGDYQWWMLPYGAAGFHENDLGGWVLMSDITVDIAAPTPVQNYNWPQDGYTIVEMDGIWWYGSEGAMWYNVKVVDTATDEVVFEEWIDFETACGTYGIRDFGSSDFAELCSLGIEDDSFLSEWGVFEIVIHAWGQGTDLTDAEFDPYFNATAPEDVPAFTKL